MNDLPLLRDLAVVFAGSLLVALLFHRLRLPSLPGFIVAGMLLGPNGLGLVSDVHRAEQFAEVGIVLLLFTIGIEFSLTRVREQAKQVLGIGFLQVGFTMAATTAAALALGATVPVAVFLGMVVAQSSTALVLKFFTDAGEIDTPHGRLSTGVLIFQDLLVVPLMLVLPFLAGTAEGGVMGVGLALGKAALVVVGVLVAARLVVPRFVQEILKTRSQELFLIAIIVLGIVTALGTAAAGASLALGAFLAGLVISESDYAHQALAELLPLRDVLISLFFVSIGMLVRLDYIAAHPALVAGGVAVVILGKTLGAAAGPALLGYSARVALLAGLAVSQIGEFAFVLANAGRPLGLLPEPLLQALLTIAVLTILVTPFLLLVGPRTLDLIERLVPVDKLIPGFRPSIPAPVGEPITNHVIVVGYGLNGRNLAAALRSVNAPHLIVDLNSSTVRSARARGEPAFYGDASREEILKLLGIERARLVVVAISDPAATRRMVRVARHMNPNVHIIARTRYVAEIAELTRLGANLVIPEEFETSLEIFSRVLGIYEVPRAEIERLTAEIRASHYDALRPGQAPRLTLASALAGVPQMSVERLTVTGSSPLVGKTLAETRLRSLTGALVLSIARGSSDIVTPDPRTKLRNGDVLVLIGQPKQIAAAAALIGGHKASAATPVAAHPPQ